MINCRGTAALRYNRIDNYLIYWEDISFVEIKMDRKFVYYVVRKTSQSRINKILIINSKFKHRGICLPGDGQKDLSKDVGDLTKYKTEYCATSWF